MRHVRALNHHSEGSISIRWASPDDAVELERVAQRDTRPLPPGPLLVAEVGGRVVAARSLATGESVADPFRPTAQLTDMLALRAQQFAPLQERRGLARWRRREYAHA